MKFKAYHVEEIITYMTIEADSKEHAEALFERRFCNNEDVSEIDEYKEDTQVNYEITEEI